MGLNIKNLIALVLLVLASTSFAQERIAYNPYGSVNWDSDLKLKWDPHTHTGTNQGKIQAYNDAGYDIQNIFHYTNQPNNPSAWTELHWPIEDWVNPNFLEQLDKTLEFFPAAEYGGQSPHITAQFFPEHFDGSGAQNTIDAINAGGGMAFIAHPWINNHNQYDHLNGFTGQEIFNNYGTAQFHLGIRNEDLNDRLIPYWDYVLMTHPRRWGVAVNDHYGPNFPYLAHGLNSRYWDAGKTIVFASTLETVKDAVKSGAMFAVRDFGPAKDRYTIPQVTVSSGVISVDASRNFQRSGEATKVKWIVNGELVEDDYSAIKGDTNSLNTNALPIDTKYVRFELRSDNGSVVYSQPFEIAPCPICARLDDINVFRGVVLEGGLAEVQESDDEYLRLNPGFTINSMETPVWVEFFGTAISATTVDIESHAGTPGLTYTVEAWNWNISGYEEIGTQAEQFGSDQNVSFDMTPDHVDPNGSVRSRVGWRRTGFTINFPWEVRVDQVGWPE